MKLQQLLETGYQPGSRQQRPGYLEISDKVIHDLQPLFIKHAAEKFDDQDKADDYVQLLNISALRTMQTPIGLATLNDIYSLSPDSRGGYIHNFKKKVASYAIKQAYNQGSVEYGYENAASLQNDNVVAQSTDRQNAKPIASRASMDPNKVAGKTEDKQIDPEHLAMLIKQVDKTRPFTPGHLKLIQLMFVDGLSKAEASRRLGVSKARITQVFRVIMAKLQTAANELGLAAH